MRQPYRKSTQEAQFLKAFWERCLSLQLLYIITFQIPVTESRCHVWPIAFCHIHRRTHVWYEFSSSFLLLSWGCGKRSKLGFGVTACGGHLCKLILGLIRLKIGKVLNFFHYKKSNCPSGAYFYWSFCIHFLRISCWNTYGILHKFLGGWREEGGLWMKRRGGFGPCLGGENALNLWHLCFGLMPSHMNSLYLCNLYL